MGTRIILIRHAATDTGARLSGSCDVPLSSTGRRQLQALAEHPATRSAPDALFTSPLSRAAAVASVLGARWALDPLPADWAREIHCGDVEGMLLEHVRRDYPRLWARNEAQSEDTFAWPGGETYAAFRARIVAGLQGTASTYAGGRVAVVTHAGVISQVIGLFRHRPASIWSLDRPAPLSATEIVWHNDGPSAVLRFSDPDWY